MLKSTVQSPAEKSAGSIEKKLIRVLYVDDEPGLLKVAKAMLELEGLFRIDAAGSVDEALTKLEKEEYDAVVSDYQMPGKDGLEFLKQLREEGNDIPFVVFTGKGREEIAIKALNLGANQYLNKLGEPETVYCELTHAILQAVERRSAHAELVRREAKLDAILESSPEAITISDLDGIIVECNQAAVDLHRGQSKKDLIGRNSFDLIAKKDHDKATQNLKRTIEQGSVKAAEYTFRDRDGLEFPAELSASVVRDASGKPECFVAITKDITERRKAEDSLRESENKFRTVFDNANDALIYMDSSGTIIDVNRKTSEVFGGTKEELIGKYFTEIGIIPVKDASELTRNFASILAGKTTNLDAAFKNKRGQHIDLECSISLVKLDEAPALVVVGRDVSERKKAERELLIKENAIASSIEGIVIADFNGNVTYVNSAFLKMWGHDSDKEIVGKSIAEMTQNGQSKKKVDEIAETLRTNGGWIGDITATRKDGSKFCAGLSASMVKDEAGKPICMLSSFVDITERKKAEAELRRLATIITDSNDAVTVVDMDGRITAWNKGAEDAYGYCRDEALGMDILKIVPEDKKQETLDLIRKIKMNETVGSLETKRLAKDGRVLDVWLTITKLVDDKGNIVALATTERDVTEKKRLEEKLRFSEKFTVLGQLASTVAHEIRNPLGVIKNSIYFLNDVLEENADEKVVKHLRIMERNVNSADRIIRDLLDVGRNRVGVLEPVDLNMVLERALANTSVPKNIKVITKLDKTPKLLLDSEHIQRVFVNIIQNAVAAMPEGGKLIVEVSRSSDSVEISFKDSGVGIPEENMQKLFTPLFTTKARGLGLGLTICKQIVESHQGDIKVKSKAGEGTLLIVRLPILSEAGLVNTGLLHADVLIGGMSE